jgi:RimJ/RimL family protein N-acetyltransferase
VVRPFTLHDGQDGLIWPLLTTDGRTTQEGWERLSERSRQDRFLHSVPRLSEEMLDLLVTRVDGEDHVALVALVLPDDGPEQVAGIARMVRYPEQPDAADVAVTVMDDWQGKGVGSALLRELARRRPVGVTRVVTSVSSENRASLALMRRLGPASVTRDGHGTSKVVVALDPLKTDSATVDDSPVTPCA